MVGIMARKRAPRQISFQEYRTNRGWGGPRTGAGRKPSPRPIVHHVRREPFRTLLPALVTVRIREGLPSLRKRPFLRVLRESFREARERGDFRLVHYSVQRDHLHFIVEADDDDALGRGMKSISSRIAFAVNRVFGRRGRVLAGRYHALLLRTPRQVRNGLRYVLLNVRKHYRARMGAAPPARLDEASSGRFFDGWKGSVRGPCTPAGTPEVAPARSFLVRKGWRRHGLIDLAEIPGRA